MGINNRNFFVYILTNHKRNVLYIGVTNNLVKRVWEHKKGLVDGFTKTYKVHDLLYYEVFDNSLSAIERDMSFALTKRMSFRAERSVVEESSKVGNVEDLPPQRDPA